MRLHTGEWHVFNYFFKKSFYFKFKIDGHWPRTADTLHAKFEILAFFRSWEIVLAKNRVIIQLLFNYLFNFFFKFKTHRHWPRTAEILHIKFEIPAFCKSWETVLAKTASLFTQLVNHLAEFDVTKPQARFPSKRNRLRWQAANHGCHCFDRASYWLLLAFSPVSIQTQC